MNLPIANAHSSRCLKSEDTGTGVIASGGSLRMYASSAAVNFGCFSGGKYIAHQNPIHRKPRSPVITNAQYHPKYNVIGGTTSGVTSAPTFVPELKIPVAFARSCFGNHSATVLIAAGKFPASPRPRKKRAAPK